MITIKALLSKAWKAIKRAPHWTLVALLSLGAIIWFLIGKLGDHRKLLFIQGRISDIEKTRAEKTTEANVINIEEEKSIRKKHKHELIYLKKEEKSLLTAEKKGPVAVAGEWSNFLLKRGK